MKFALFILASWTENDAAHQRRIYQEALEQVRYAEALGFDSVWIAEHHSSRYGIFPSLMPILAHIAAQTTTIRLGAGVSVLPFHHPIRLAEEAAMVDVLSDGRLNFGVGEGRPTTNTAILRSISPHGIRDSKRRWTLSWACGRPRTSPTTANTIRLMG
jgi:alkanesulfonate monooxygenase SsuD/methylene tetrahydromethanopterin reductase-like flavin-dependent oxidoreductase (luciferase family)